MNLRHFSLFDPLSKIVEELNKFKPDCLVANSFFLAILAGEQIAGRLTISFDHPLSFLAGCGEPLTERTKALAHEAWNATIHDSYGSAECYFMATSCADFGHLHVMSDLCILEIVDRHNHPVAPGQYGEKVLLTNLLNFVQPIIRYEIEDVAGYSENSCGCGLNFPTLLPIQGRTTDFFYFKTPRGGYERLHPYRLRPLLFNICDLRQYQIIQTSRNELTVLYVPEGGAVGLVEKIKHAIENALIQRGLESRVTLKLRQVESIPRHGSSSKIKMIQSLGAPVGWDSPEDPIQF